MREAVASVATVGVVGGAAGARQHTTISHSAKSDLMSVRPDIVACSSLTRDERSTRQLREQRKQRVFGHRLGEPVALVFVAAFAAQEVELIAPLHPLGHDVQAERVT